MQDNTEINMQESTLPATPSSMEVQHNTQDSTLPPTHTNNLGEIVWRELLSGNYDLALRTVQSDEHVQYLRTNSLELVPTVTQLLQEDVGLAGEQCVGDILLHIAKVTNPKEMVLVLLEMMEMKWSVMQLRVLLPSLQAVLLRQASPENTRSVTFSWVLNSLYSHVSAMPIPKGLNLEGKERQLLDADPMVMEASDILQHITHFYEGFFTRVVSGQLVWGGGKDSREYLALFLLQLFHKPITYLDVYEPSNKDSCNALYRTCCRLASMVAQLLFNVFKLLDRVVWKCDKTILAAEGQDSEGQDTQNKQDKQEGSESDGESESEEQVSQVSLACFYYCVLAQHMTGGDYVPLVYSHHHVFLTCLSLVNTLLQDKEHIPIHKGLVLSRALLDKLGIRTLPGDSLEAPAHSSFPQLLVRVMTLCDNRELRLLALEIFRTHMDKFDAHGRRRLILAVLLSVKHAGVLGLVIHELKQNVHYTLSQDNLDPNFSGRHLLELLKAACVLPQAEQTDLLEWSDCIMAALNLLIYLFIRDKDNRTGITSVCQSLQEGYLTHLQTGLDLTKGHYELKLKELQETPARKQAKTSVCVAGQMLPNLPRDQERKVVEDARCSLDMMQCVLARTIQAMEKKA